MATELERLITLQNKKQNAKKSELQQLLEKKGYEFDNNGDIIVDLIAETDNGKKNFGKVTYDAYKAVTGNTLDSYKPKNDEEKKVLDGYKQYTGMFIPNNATANTNTSNTSQAPKEEAKAVTPSDTTKEQEAYIKYAINKESDIKGVNNEQKLLGGDTAQYIAAPKKSAWDKFTDNVSNWFEDTFSGTMADKWNQERTGFVDNKAAWTDDQLATLAVDALHRADQADTRDFAIVDQAYARLSRSSKYKDSDLVLALNEAKKSWGASPLTAAGKNVKAAVYGMGADFASFTDSIGADKIPGLNSFNDAVINAGKQAREEASTYNKGLYGETLGTFTQGVVNLAPYFFLGSGKAATTALSKAPKYATYIKTIAQNPSFWYSLTTMWGQKYQEALDGGASKSDALNNAILYSVPAALVEVSGGIGSSKGNEKLSTTILEEIGEEIAQDIISGASDKATTNPNLPVFSMSKEAIVNPVNLAKTAITTAPIVAVAGGANVGINKIANLTNQRIQMRKITNEKKVIDSITKFTNDAYSKMSSDDVDISKLSPSNAELKKIGELYSEESTLEALIQDGLESPEGTTSRSIAETLNKKVKAKENIRNQEIGGLVVANIKQVVSEQVTEEKAKADTKESNVEDNTNIPYNAPVNPAIFTGDVFKDASTGNTFTVVNRDSGKTVVEIETPKGTVTREFSDSRMDSFVESGQIEKIENGPTNQILADYESEADELMSTDMSDDVETQSATENTTTTEAETLAPEEAQKYNIVVSNLKRKAEELGLLDSKFFTALQNVNLYNPTANDRALISSEFQRVFANNTDPLVTNWLNAIGVDAQPVTSINEENTHDALDNKYLESVKQNDLTTAQKMVDEAAQSNEYSHTGYHGTKSGVEITVFDKSKQGSTDKGVWGRGFYFSDNMQKANMFSGGKKAKRYHLKITNPFYISDFKTVEEISDYLGVAKPAFSGDERAMFKYDNSGMILLNTKYSQEFSDAVQSKGHDGIIVNFKSNDGDNPANATEIIVFSPNQIKSADAVVYDDNGNVVPLSKRFDDASNDVRGNVGNITSNAATTTEAETSLTTKETVSKTENVAKETESTPIEKSSTTESVEKKQKKKIIRAKKSDWATHDVIWTAPNSKTVVAYSTRAASDLIEVMAEDNTEMTISELHDAINYDEEAKKVLQAYIDNGFGDDIASKYFVHNKNTSVKSNDADKTLQNLSESDTIEERKTTDNNERVGVENGVDEGGIIPESNQQRSEAQETGKQSDKVQDRVLGTDDKGKPELILYKRGYNDTSRRIEQVETRKLEDIYSDEKFKTFKGIVNDSIPAGFVNIAFVEIYSNDTRINGEGYDFEEVFAYDLISGKEKELSSLFYDEIAEYFNQNNSKDADSTGQSVHQSTLERLKDSIVRNVKGQLIPVYHSTTANFGKFEIGDIGYHFGSYIQAYQRNIDKSNVRYIKAYLDIKNPLVFDSDSMGWNAEQVLQKLAEKGVISTDEAISFIGTKISHEEVNNIIRAKLEKAGYDGIVYKNQYESINADSYIVFDDSQIIRIEDGGKTETSTPAIKNKTESDLTKEPDNASPKSKGTKQIADYVAKKLAKGEKISALELSKKATEFFGGTMSNNVFTVKDAYDAMELGVNQHILSMKEVSSEKMLELLELLPTQTKRTEEMDKFQQFSTPPSIAYLANYTANVNENDIMLEPSAGIGGIAVFAKKDGAKVYVNELDNRRLDVLKNMPFDGFYNEDAEQLNNILGGEIQPTVIVMNPPFSSSSERNMKNTKIGAKHIEQALKILAPNGRLVAIVGKGMADGEPAFRTWWKDIKSQYNVRANIGINGKNYNKYGTNFDIQMLVIDKNGPTTETVTGYVDTLQELQDKLGGIRDERPAIDYSGNEQRTPRATRTEVTPKGKTTDNGNSVVSDTSGVADKGKSTDKRETTGKSTDQNIQSTDAEHGKSSSTTTENTDVVAGEDGRVGSRESDGLDGEENSVGTDNSNSGQSDIQTGRVESRKRVKHKELTDSIFEQYQTQPLKVKNAQPHPAKVSESAAMSAIEPPPITYTPNLPKDIIEKGVVSDVQLEAISYAGQSHSQTLPNGTTRGFFLGDGTGIGKGRTIAGMMLDNYNQGRKKAVWVTLNSSLVNDAKRDVKALFGDSDLVTQFVGGNKADSVLNTDEAIMVISYSALAKGFDNKDSNFEKIVKWLGEDFDGLIVFDEAHKMGNATSTKGTRGMKKASQTGIAGIALQEALPKAKIVYSSATGATEVENLRYAERLGLWGEGTPFIKGDDFVSKIKAGGLAAMELIARDMKAMGVYLSRNISYDDVQYDKITHNLTAQQTKIYDELARSWQIVLQNINKALENTNQDKDGHARGRALGAFWSSQQRFFNQILTSMQVPSVISDIEKQLADGKSCVIQLVSTNEAAQNQEFERLKAEDLELDEFDLTPKQVLMSLIENSFPVQQFEEYRDDNGNVRSRPVYDSKGNPVINREAVGQRDELLAKLGSIKVPSSPIDMIINHFGTDLVAENTGRARRVIQKDGKTIEEKIGNKKDADVDAFQNGDKRIIIFSKAGGTGKSYHADKAAKNQQQRVHYLLEAGWQADNAVQGFGRSHRSNQVSAPIFKLVTTNLKGQMRFISTIAKRLDQLGAMTKGQRQAGGQGMFSASDNLENSFAADVLAGFYKDLLSNKVEGIDDGLAILEKLGLKSKILDEYGRIIPTAPELREVNKFLNRILSLESAEQNTIFEGYSQRLQEATENAMQAGTLDKGLENYKADKITLNEVQDIREDEKSGAKTKYYNLTAQHKVKVIKFTDVPATNKSFVGFYQNKNTGAIRAVFQTSSTTDKFGNVVSNYKLMGQAKNEYIPQNRFYGNWTELDSTAVEKLWDEEVSKLPEYRQENLHLISGVVLPVWDKLPTENVRIYRVLTSDGEMLIGRVIPENMIDQTLKRLGSSRKKEKIATKDLITGIKNGDTVTLDNGWKIVQRKVSGENRIEVVGPAYEHHDLLKDKGVFTERIQYFTRYFIPADTNTEKVLDEILKISPVSIVENANYSYSLESEENYEQSRNLLHNDSEQWYAREYSGEQVAGLAKATESGSETAKERKAYTEKLKNNQLDKKVITDKNGIKHTYTEIKSSAWNDQMNKIADYYAQKDVNVHFIKGSVQIAFVGEEKTAKAMRVGNDIYISYDNAWYTPEQLSMHEYIHIKYESPEFQKTVQDIIEILPKKEYNKLVDKVKKAYGDIIDNPNAYEVELICDILSGMTPSSLLQNGEIVLKFWAKESAGVLGYDASLYADSIDAGGVNSDVLDSIGFGNEFGLSEAVSNIPLNEYMQLREYIVKKNNEDVELLPADGKEIGNNFYTWCNIDKMNYEVVDIVPITDDYDVNAVRSGINNGTIRRTKSVSEWSANIRSGRRNSSLLGGGIEETAPNRGDDRFSVRQSESDTLGHLAKGGRVEAERINTVIDYSLSVDSDATELTPERKKEILEQYERDRVGVEKPTQKQLWGERAEWIAHNISRVFPNIPERGKKGTFFAEFRKNMVQWNGLSSTADFMVKDKLNEMTKGLTPDEFKTFGELVYFLDLQEEAQMQKDRGYDEILLPNEITPDEVNAIVEIINEEATDNVKKALAKRQQIWDNLKEQYIALNQHIGFNTDEKFKRKNYYHHQVIEYMNSRSKGTGSREINIKAGRGWLKERQGSTKAINTDFLAVEHKAMLQMQYDIYVAQILGKTKDRYDIKPQLEKQAFNNNKKLLNDIIIKEATDENGNIMLDQKGKPDSETYREQQSYNRDIMRGFNGLFELAELDVLPTFNGQYSNAIRALRTQNLNAPGLYNYVAELASMELSETATDEELQAQISARTVLKYTSQKKAWVKEVLGNDYQTWETIAKSMSDTHTIHQPRRGNYFYTKEILNEDAFDKAFNDMIVGLVAGENGIDTTEDIKKLFGQYSETIRQIGAAYEQWVLPNEIVTTMQEVGNPKAVSEGQKMSRAIMSAWKGAATSVNLFRTVKFGIRNMAGDLDAVIAGNPKILRYSKQALQEIYQAMRHKNYSDSFIEFVERGGYTSMIFANEMDTEMQEKLFSHLMEKTGLKGKNILEIPASILKDYQNGVETAHNFREAILRYSAYLYYKEAINRNGGVVKDYVASNRYIVKGLDSVEDKAYQLAKDLLGAYDEIGKMGQTLRRYWIPFYSFTETNMKRYYRLFENIIMSDDNIPKKAGKLLLKTLMINLFGLLLNAWNKLVMKEDDDKLPTSARNVPHLTLGTIGDNVYAFRQLGSFSDILEWIGLEDFKWESADEPFKEVVNKAYGMINPGFKYLFELPSGMNSYPDVFKPSPIRDRMEYLANSWGVAELYNEVSGKPTRGLGDILKSAFVYSYDIEDSIYNEIRSLKYAFQGKDDGTTYKPNKKSNALYYMKKAVKYKDKETALKYLNEYFENGGTAKGITQSFSTLNPMYGFTGKDTIKKGEAFIATLTPEEKEKLKIAQDYYEKELMLPENVSRSLGKKNITEEQAKNLLKNYINSVCK